MPRETDTTIYYEEEEMAERRFVARARRLRRTYELDSKELLVKAIRQLEELAQEAHIRATSKYLPTEHRQNWARIEAYIYQTINSLLKTYDSRMALEKLEELERLVEELMAKDKESGEED